MSRTIKAIERHMVPQSKRETVQPQMEKNLTAEWQRGLESATGSAQRKLHLAFAPAHSPALATINH
jgi:hypothetical protein